jgi:ferredoxin
MRVVVDGDRCTGHGRCYILAPEVYDADDDGYSRPGEREVAAALEAKARQGALNCPEDAIEVIE